jgi:hypothetical protein
LHESPPREFCGQADETDVGSGDTRHDYVCVDPAQRPVNAHRLTKLAYEPLMSSVGRPEDHVDTVDRAGQRDARCVEGHEGDPRTRTRERPREQEDLRLCSSRR